MLSLKPGETIEVGPLGHTQQTIARDLGDEAVRAEPDELLYTNATACRSISICHAQLCFPIQLRKYQKFWHCFAREQFHLRRAAPDRTIRRRAGKWSRASSSSWRAWSDTRNRSDQLPCRSSTRRRQPPRSHAVAHLGLHYVPDPSSQTHFAPSAKHCGKRGRHSLLKYGTTTDHVLGLKVVLAVAKWWNWRQRRELPARFVGLFIGRKEICSALKLRCV